MTPNLRFNLIERLSEILPLPHDGCPYCDPNGGCANPAQCVRDLASDVLAVVEREIGK